jgi:hypothetical protein
VHSKLYSPILKDRGALPTPNSSPNDGAEVRRCGGAQELPGLWAVPLKGIEITNGGPSERRLPGGCTARREWSMPRGGGGGGPSLARSGFFRVPHPTAAFGPRGRFFGPASRGGGQRFSGSWNTRHLLGAPTFLFHYLPRLCQHSSMTLPLLLRAIIRAYFALCEIKAPRVIYRDRHHRPFSLRVALGSLFNPSLQCILYYSSTFLLLLIFIPPALSFLH